MALTDLQGCTLHVEPTKIACKYSPESFSDQFPSIVDTASCDAHYAEAAADYGCDYDTGEGEVDIEALKKFFETNDPDGYKVLVEEELNWTLYMSEMNYPTFMDF